MESSVIRRVAIYCRVSTHEQNVDLQLTELREYSARRGLVIAGEYLDLGISGSKASRPELNRLMDDSRLRLHDAVLVWKLDRFARSLKNLVVALEDLNHFGVSFISLRDNLDLSSPSGRLMMHLLGAMSEFERELIRERVCAGIQAAKRRGVRVGRPPRWISAEKVRSLREAGTPWRAIARKMDCGVGTAMKALREDPAA
jgi:DNA invertase Pin-like site-specific DNA recombinase